MPCNSVTRAPESTTAATGHPFRYICAKRQDGKADNRERSSVSRVYTGHRDRSRGPNAEEAESGRGALEPVGSTSGWHSRHEVAPANRRAARVEYIGVVVRGVFSDGSGHTTFPACEGTSVSQGALLARCSALAARTASVRLSSASCSWLIICCSWLSRWSLGRVLRLRAIREWSTTNRVGGVAGG